MEILLSSLELIGKLNKYQLDQNQNHKFLKELEENTNLRIGIAFTAMEEKKWWRSTDLVD